jgi:hypothetical protein
LVNSRNIIIGFNNDRFDNNVCKANSILIQQAKSYDLWKAVTNTQPPGQRFGFSLDNLLKVNGLETKSGLGADAPRQAQQGEWGKLINYCMDDTRKEVQILRLACNGMLKNPKNSEYMKIKLPWEVVQVETGGLF